MQRIVKDRGGSTWWDHASESQENMETRERSNLLKQFQLTLLGINKRWIFTYSTLFAFIIRTQTIFPDTVPFLHPYSSLFSCTKNLIFQAQMQWTNSVCYAPSASFKKLRASLHCGWRVSIPMRNETLNATALSSAFFYTFWSEHSIVYSNLASIIYVRLQVAFNWQCHGVFLYMMPAVLWYNYDVSTGRSHLDSCTHSALHRVFLNPGTPHSAIWVVWCVTCWMHPMCTTLVLGTLAW